MAIYSFLKQRKDRSISKTLLYTLDNQPSSQMQQRKKSATTIFLALVLCLCGQSFIASTIFAAPRFASSPPNDEYLARAGVSLVRLLVKYSSPSAPAKGLSPCTGLGVLVSSWKPSGPTQFETSVLTDGSLFDTQNAAGCISVPPLGRSIDSIQIFFSNLYNHSNASSLSLKKGDFSVTCSDEQNCNNGPALLSFSSALPLPFLALAQNSNTSGFKLALTDLIYKATFLLPIILIPLPSQLS